jgi:hypothetical protein
MGTCFVRRLVVGYSRMVVAFYPIRRQPDPTRVTQKQKHSNTAYTTSQQRHSSTPPRESHKKYRQLQLWEAPQSSETNNSTIPKKFNVDQPASSTVNGDNMEQIEQMIQVQWLHRWFDESSQEDLTPLPAGGTWTGSPIMCSLAQRKQQ